MAVQWCYAQRGVHADSHGERGMQDASRREFLRASGSLIGGGWLALNAAAVWAAAEAASEAKSEARDWANLTTEEAAELAAVADQIFPPGDTPGASEIGAVHFMDAAFGGFMAGPLPMVREGLADLATRAQSAGAERFSGLPFERQTEVLAQVEDTPMFGTLHFLTLCGLFTMPAHGGNRGGLGWKALGFEPRHVWQPPFGAYDAEMNDEAGSDAGA